MADTTSSSTAKKTDEKVTSLKDVVHPADMEPNRVPTTDVKSSSGTTSRGTKVTGSADLIKKLKG